MSSTYNLPIYSGNQYYVSSGRNTNRFYIADDWLYKPGTYSNNITIFNISSATYSGILTDATYFIGAYAVNGAAVKGDYLYTVSPTGGTYGYLNVINVSNKTAPTRTTSKADATYMYGPYYAYATSDYIYIGANGAANNYVSIWSLATPSNPTRVAQISYSSTVIGEVYVYDEYLYVCYGSTVGVYSLSNPASPSLSGTMTPAVGNVPTILHGNGNYMYVSAWNASGFDIWDITNKNSPVKQSSHSIDDDVGNMQPGDMWVNSQGTLLFITDRYYSNGVLIYDVSDKTAPVYLNKFTYAYAGKMQSYDGLLYIGGSNDSDDKQVISYDVTDHKFSGYTDSSIVLYAYRPSDGQLFDTWSGTMGNYEAWPIFPADPLHLLAVRIEDNNETASFGSVTPVIVS